ncbi:MAG TPA: amino acid racemase [Candidatus Sulfotelmatobacter sp.]|nr:amino acid racemase [Candidatus Sulfotelmatobacter sp.]
MKTLGIVGGIGPESTIEYYRQLMAGYRKRTSDDTYPRLLIDSIDVNRLLFLAAQPERQALVDYLLESVSRLARAGVDLALLAANTPHLVFGQLALRSPIPLISIVEATCEFAKAHRLNKLGLWGTRFTMQAGFYQEAGRMQDIAIVLPDLDEQSYIHERYVNELVKGVFLPETRDGMLAIAGAMKERDHIEGVILGGTELPLLLRDEREIGISFLDTTRIHVNAALDRILTTSD